MPRKREPKLKTSCNSCSSAKVRCQKDSAVSESTSWCLRCVELNLECVYGISQRKGKPFKQPRQNELSPLHVENERQNSDSKSTYPWPSTSWNLSDVGRPIDFSSVELDYSLKDSHHDTLGTASIGQHSVCSIMTDASSFMLKLDTLLHGTCDITGNTDQLWPAIRSVRNRLNQVLRCRCNTCTSDPNIVFLLATLGSKLSGSYRDLLGCLSPAANTSLDNSTYSAVNLLRTEVNEFKETCSLIREKATESNESKGVSEAFYELLHNRVNNLLCSLDDAIAIPI
jgi:Fungal Zn(2)-Cys(6) binuclear cluster domain